MGVGIENSLDEADRPWWARGDSHFMGYGPPPHMLGSPASFDTVDLCFLLNIFIWYCGSLFHSGDLHLVGRIFIWYWGSLFYFGDLYLILCVSVGYFGSLFCNGYLYLILFILYWRSFYDTWDLCFMVGEFIWYLVSLFETEHLCFIQVIFVWYCFFVILGIFVWYWIYFFGSGNLCFVLWISIWYWVVLCWGNSFVTWYFCLKLSIFVLYFLAHWYLYSILGDLSLSDCILKKSVYITKCC